MIPHPVLANDAKGATLHWVHAKCAKDVWGLEGYALRTEREPGHPCCLCGNPAVEGALLGHSGALPCHARDHAAHHRGS
jgi:hypothetical protein